MPTVATPKQNSVKPFPFLDLKAQYRSIKPEIDAAIQRVMESQHFILGPEVESLEKEIAAYSHSQFGIGCASGSDALLLALMALEIGPGDEVITTPFTFVATAGAIARLRARPVFVDIDPETYNIHPLKIDAAVTSNTKAIIPVHLFGMAADMDAIMKIAKAKNIPCRRGCGSSYRRKLRREARGQHRPLRLLQFLSFEKSGRRRRWRHAHHQRQCAGSEATCFTYTRKPYEV